MMSSTPPDFSKNPVLDDSKLIVDMHDYFMAIQNKYYFGYKTMWIEIIWLNQKIAVVKQAFVEMKCRGPGWFLLDLAISQLPMNVQKLMEYREPPKTIWELEFRLDDDDRCYELVAHNSIFKEIPFFDYEPKDY